MSVSSINAAAQVQEKLKYDTLDVFLETLKKIGEKCPVRRARTQSGAHREHVFVCAGRKGINEGGHRLSF